MRKRNLWSVPLLLACQLAGCSDLGAITSLADDPFILSGTAIIENKGGPCPAWLGENGVKYYLFQGERLTNDEFDRLRTEGVTSRLEIKVRKDLVVECSDATTAEVERVLEIDD